MLSYACDWKNPLDPPTLHSHLIADLLRNSTVKREHIHPKFAQLRKIARSKGEADGGVGLENISKSFDVVGVAQDVLTRLGSVHEDVPLR